MKTFLHTHQLILRINSQRILTEANIFNYICSFTKGLPKELDFNYLLKSGKIGYLSLETVKTTDNGFSYMMRIPLSVNTSILSKLPALLERITRVNDINVEIEFVAVKDQRALLLDELEGRSKEIEQLITKTVSNQEETPSKLFHKGFYVGKDFLTSEEVFIVEGRKDLDALASTNEYYNTLAIGGDSYDIGLLRGILNNKITTLFLDSDEPGRKAQTHLLESLEIDFVIIIPFKTEVEFLTPRMVNKLISKRIPTEIYLRRQRNMGLIEGISRGNELFEYVNTLLSTQPFQSLIEIDSENREVLRLLNLKDYLANPIDFGGHTVLFNGLLTMTLYEALRKHKCSSVITRGVIHNVKPLDRCKIYIIDLL